MKIPKAISICGKLFQIKTDSSSGGGCFTCEPPLIIVGTKFLDRIQEIIVHEITEVIFALRDMRYYQRTGIDNGDLLFSFNHKEFESAMLDLSCALAEIKFGGK